MNATTRRHHARTPAALATLAAVALGGCGQGDDVEPDPAPDPVRGVRLDDRPVGCRGSEPTSCQRRGGLKIRRPVSGSR